MQIWIKLDLVVLKLAWGIRWSFIKALKNLKICNLMESFCPKCNASARKFQGNYVSWHWKVMQNLNENWLVPRKMTRNLVNFHASSWKSENLHFDWIHLSKAYKYLDEKVQRSYVSWHWRAMQSLKKNWLLVPKMTWGNWWILMPAVASLEVCNLMHYFCQ